MAEPRITMRIACIALLLLFVGAGCQPHTCLEYGTERYYVDYTATAIATKNFALIGFNKWTTRTVCVRYAERPNVSQFPPACYNKRATYQSRKNRKPYAGL